MKLHLTNFRTYDDVHMEFDTGLTLISGDSGCGKSSILMALHFVLFSYGTPAYQKYNTKGCSVELRDDTFVIKRTRRPNNLILRNTKTGDVYHDDAAQVVINKVYGAQFDVTSYIPQLKNTSYITMTNAERLSFLETFVCNGEEKVSKLKLALKDVISKSKSVRDKAIGSRELASSLYDLELKKFEAIPPVESPFPAGTNYAKMCKNTEIRRNNYIVRLKKDTRRMEEIAAVKMRLHEALTHEAQNLHKITSLNDSLTKLPTYSDEELEALKDRYNVTMKIGALESLLEAKRAAALPIRAVVDTGCSCPSCGVLLDLKSVKPLCLVERSITVEGEQDESKPIQDDDDDVVKLVNMIHEMKTQPTATRDEVRRCQASRDDELALKARLESYKDQVAFYSNHISSLKEKMETLENQTTMVDGKPVTQADIDSLNITLAHISRYDAYCVAREQMTEWKARLAAAELTERETTKRYECAVKLRELVTNAGEIALSSAVAGINVHATQFLDQLFVEHPIMINVSTDGVNISYRGNDTTLAALSGGEFARVDLAYTLALHHMVRTPLLLLDECVAHLHQDLSSIVFRMIDDTFGRSGIVIIVAHQVVEGAFTRVIRL